MKKVLKALLIILLIIVIAAVILFAWLSITEFKPDAVMEVTPVENLDDAKALSTGDKISVLSWNIGYAGLGEKSDFFMDGGESVAAADKEQVQNYLDGIYSTVYGGENTPDIVMLQEVDENSSRTYGINEVEKLGIYNNSFAKNYSCSFVPYPLPPIGRVNSGLLTNTVYEISSAERISLPCPFSWPVSTANLKRCMLVSYLPIENSDKQLVIVNLHLEAYDDGEGKIAQTKQLLDFIQSEYDKGNFVIAGGDFNQEFPGALNRYPNTHTDLWAPGLIDNDMLNDGWQFAYDLDTPTCRLLNQPYNPSDAEGTQYYVIDGFILSPNINLDNVETLNMGFENSDHNPVKLDVTLK